VARCYERGSIIISNQCLGAWSKVFGDQAIASAILDRLLHHSITININLSAQGKTEVAGLLKPKIGQPPGTTSPGVQSGTVIR
jgi:hypothetical protein